VSDPTVLVAVFGVFSSIIAAVFAANAFTQKTLVSVLNTQITTIQEEKKALIIDNKEQAQVIGKLGVSVDKLTEQGGQTIRLLEDVVYGRQQAQQQRRSQ
jgi:glutamate racemase